MKARSGAGIHLVVGLQGVALDGREKTCTSRPALSEPVTSPFGIFCLRNLISFLSTCVKHASALVVHYDVWLEAFDRWRGDHAPQVEDRPTFVFVGPAGFPFHVTQKQ